MLSKLHMSHQNTLKVSVVRDKVCSSATFLKVCCHVAQVAPFLHVSCDVDDHEESSALHYIRTCTINL